MKIKVAKIEAVIKRFSQIRGKRKELRRRRSSQRRRTQHRDSGPRSSSWRTELAAFAQYQACGRPYTGPDEYQRARADLQKSISSGPVAVLASSPSKKANQSAMQSPAASLVQSASESFELRARLEQDAKQQAETSNPPPKQMVRQSTLRPAAKAKKGKKGIRRVQSDLNPPG